MARIPVLDLNFNYHYFYLSCTGLQDSDDDMEEVSQSVIVNSKSFYLM